VKQKDKAYKLLALQENISNRAAKDLIDRGVVFAKGEKLKVARGLIETNTKFVIQKVQKIQKLEPNEIKVENKHLEQTLKYALDFYESEAQRKKTVEGKSSYLNNFRCYYCSRKNK